MRALRTGKLMLLSFRARSSGSMAGSITPTTTRQTLSGKMRFSVSTRIRHGSLARYTGDTHRRTFRDFAGTGEYQQLTSIMGKLHRGDNVVAKVGRPASKQAIESHC
ncbi:hypothetical protein GGR56DRAFT_556910 [Xylariaceae sp. FL0804]|nr:hypothetical protein GGR56DRAFT_556910 [Xylariaceae sp. FL0804]